MYGYGGHVAYPDLIGLHLCSLNFCRLVFFLLISFLSLYMFAKIMLRDGKVQKFNGET